MKISERSWQERLARWVRNPGKRLALVGIGNEQRRDDAAGVWIARRLAPLASDSLLILDAGHAPENSTAALRRFAPDSILLIDAAEMGEAPGSVRLLETAEIEGMSASTHSLPLSMLADYLRLELGCEVLLLGIQPASTEYGEGIGEEVGEALRRIIPILRSGGTQPSAPASRIYP